MCHRSKANRASTSGASFSGPKRTSPTQRRSTSDHSQPGATTSAPRNSNKGSKRGNRKSGARLDASEFFPSRSPGNTSQALLGFRQGSDSHEEFPRPRFDRGHRKKGGQIGRGGRVTYKKEHFLQASFRFVVSDAVDVAKHSRDPDAMFDWDDVLQVCY